MIVRSGVDIGNLFETIHASRFLGECDEKSFTLFKLQYPEAKITQNPRERGATQCLSQHTAILVFGSLMVLMLKKRFFPSSSVIANSDSMLLRQHSARLKGSPKTSSGLRRSKRNFLNRTRTFFLELTMIFQMSRCTWCVLLSIRLLMHEEE